MTLGYMTQHHSASCPVNLTEQQAADHLAITIRSLQRLRKLGDGPPHAKLGKGVIYRREDLDRWMAARVAEQPTGTVTP